MNKRKTNKRILHVLVSLNMGGIEKSVVESSELLNQKGYGFDFVTERSEDNQLSRRAKLLDGAVFELGSFQKRLQFAKRFTKHLRQNGPYDAVHSHPYYYSGIVVFLSWCLGVKIRIAHIHTDRRSEQKSFFAKVYAWLMSVFIRVFSTDIIAVSSSAADNLRGSFMQSKQSVHPMGIALNPFKTKFDTKTLQEDLKLDAERRYIVHVGRFSKEKNHKFLLKLFQKFYNENQNVDLVLIGDGILRNDIEEQAMQTGLKDRVLFLGEKQNCTEILRMLKTQAVFCFPSQYEGLGLAPIEAQIAGLAVVMSNNVPPEAEVVPERVFRLSLEDDISEWEKAVRMAFKASRVESSEIYDRAKKSHINIDSYVRFIDKIYSK